MVAPKYRKLAAIAIGLALAGMPAFAVHSWLSGYVERQAASDLDVAARRVIALADTRLTAVIAVLDDLVRRGVRSCAQTDLAAMNEASFSVSPVKELSVIAADGATVCTNLAIPLGERVVVSHIASGGDNVLIEVLKIGDRKDSVVRVRRMGGPEGTGLAVLIPSDMLLPRISPTGGQEIARARIETAEGVLIGERAGSSAASDEGGDRMAATLRSTRYGVAVTVSMPRALVSAGTSDLVTIGTAGTGSAAALILALAAFGRFRPRDNPIADLERAIKNDEFVPYYQPIVDLTTARVTGAEVLIRWRRADGTLVPPAQFIPLAEFDWADRADHARTDAPRLRAGRCSDRRPPAFLDRLQSRGASLQRRERGRGRARDHRPVADRAQPGAVRGDRAPAPR